ncbi:hypothetical protein GCM10010294_25250 [Streptomyces griseoloalbus]|uniref:hypothetical protein n=1 Tax=Streptomyces griseoloalbus TaxID=67303 RepID=UPI00187643AB|nr:hypothetical protein GCM10010294_25250 [Streptomyces griseoloalbus]
MTTPAEELRRAAFLLRNPIRQPELCAVSGLDFTEPLSEWLEHAAHHYECGIRAADEVFRDDPDGRSAFLTTGPGAPSPHALAVARAINGEAQ